MIISKSSRGVKLNSSAIILEVTLTTALDNALLLDNPDAIGSSDSVLKFIPKSSGEIPYFSKVFLAQISINVVGAPTSLEQVIELF